MMVYGGLWPVNPELQSLGPVVQPGAVLLAKYRIESVIGVGGMGAVVGARHLQLDERVAIKVLLPSVATNEEVVQRFLREARAAIKIRSEHCVRVLDVGTLESGAPFMVMEYLEGQDLSVLVERHRPLPIPDVIDWALQAAEALAEAHAMGIVHRDLKPANLFLTHRLDGTPSVKVLDFGISKQAASGADAGVTKTQAVLGSPRYMSPEQMRSTKDVDARADVWALGAVVHELIAGIPPFDADTMTALCAAILQDPPKPMTLLRRDVSPQLEAAVRGALEKDRNRRYPNMAALSAALAPFGGPGSRLSAERIARVLSRSMGTGTGPLVQSNPSGAQLVASAAWPSARTVDGSVTSTPGLPQRRGGMVVAFAAAGGLLVIGGIVAFVALRRADHAPASATGTSATTAVSAAALSAEAAPVATAPVVLAEPSTNPSPENSAAPGATGGVPPPSSRPVAPSPPAKSGSHPAGPAKPPSNNSNPFGDDRKG
jgi:serine/threonine-protein kinase